MAMLLNVAERELRPHLLAAENNGFVVMGNDSLPLNTLAFLFVFAPTLYICKSSHFKKCAKSYQCSVTFKDLSK